ICQTSAAKSWRRSVTRNSNRTPVMIRLRLQMLAPLSTRCSWKRRTSSGVAVSGERLSQAANRLQLETWLRCVCGVSLRAAISSSIRRRSGLTVSVLFMESSILSEVVDTSILRTGLSICYRGPLALPASRLLLPRSGLERSDFVLWPSLRICDVRSFVANEGQEEVLVTFAQRRD